MATVRDSEPILLGEPDSVGLDGAVSRVAVAVQVCRNLQLPCIPFGIVAVMASWLFLAQSARVRRNHAGSSFRSAPVVMGRIATRPAVASDAQDSLDRIVFLYADFSWRRIPPHWIYRLSSIWLGALVGDGCRRSARIETSPGCESGTLKYAAVVETPCKAERAARVLRDRSTAVVFRSREAQPSPRMTALWCLLLRHPYWICNGCFKVKV